MSRFIAVGDIHGCSQTLARLLEILDLRPGDTLLSTGDLSSKGEDSRGVHTQLLDIEKSAVRVIVLLGNHEVMLLAMQRTVGANVDLSAFPESMFHDADVSFLMRSNETWATLRSYGLGVADDPESWAFQSRDPRRHFEKVTQRLSPADWLLPQSHLDFLCRCRTHHIERNCLFVHSGIQPAYLSMDNVYHAVETQLRHDAKQLCWNRDWLGQAPQARRERQSVLPRLHG